MSTKKNIIKFILFLGLILLCLIVLSDNMELKKSDAKRHGFYKTGKECDVLVFGSSRVINGVFPLQLWEKYGLAVYNFGGHAESLCANYWNIVNALHYSKPKLVIVDVSMCTLNMKYEEDRYYFLHNSLDSMPLSLTKVKALRDLVPGSEIDFILPFIAYHQRWEEIIHQVEPPEYNIEYGSEKRIGVTPIDKPELVEDMYDGEETISMLYLRKIVDLCKERDTEILFINMPYAANDQLSTNYIGNIAKEYDVGYYNIFRESYDILDYKTDFYDEQHLNPSGAEKITNLLGEYLKSNYDLPDRSDDEALIKLYEEYMSMEE